MPGEQHCGLAEYHPPLVPENDGAPWQELWPFTNVCSGLLCHPDEGACSGTRDHFVLTVDPAFARHRFAFFEGCDQCSWSSAYFPRGEGFRTDGRYSFLEGQGSRELAPSDELPSVGHVRRYSRGACTWELDIMAIPTEGLGGPTVTLTELLTQSVRQKLEEPYGVMYATPEAADAGVYLGSWDCTNEVAPSEDYVLANLQFLVVMGEHGFGEACQFRGNLHLWFTPTTSERDGHRQFDVANYGFEYEATDLSVPGAWWCPAFYDGFVVALEAVHDHPREGLFDELVETVDDMLWIEDSFVSCEFNPCPDASPYNFSSRCNEQTHFCAFRPNDIYDVNLYPSAVDFTLARTTESPEYGLLAPYESPSPTWQFIADCGVNDRLLRRDSDRWLR